MRDRLQLIAGSVLSSHLSDPSAARGQALGALVQGTAAGGHGYALIALGATLIAALCGVLLFEPGNHGVHQRGGVRRAGSDFRALAGGQAVLPAGAVPARAQQSRFTAMFRAAGRRAQLMFAAALAIGLAAASASATQTEGPLGTWSTANGHGVIAITPCGDALCGRIVGIDRKPTEPMPTDVDGRSQCGLTIITNEKPQGNGTWLGEITDPRDGGTYQAKLWLGADGNLRLRGFIGIPALGATQTWHRFTGHLTAACGLA